jgi:hypothetical protein
MSVMQVEVRSKLPGGGGIPDVLVELSDDRTRASMPTPKRRDGSAAV